MPRSLLVNPQNVASSSSCLLNLALQPHATQLCKSTPIRPVRGKPEPWEEPEAKAADLLTIWRHLEFS